VTVLLWDFFGPAAEGTARHFRRHLDEFMGREGIVGCTTGVDAAAEGHFTAWLRGPEEAAGIVARVLRPRRRREERGDEEREPVN
jgi:hypothetical protein